LADVVAGDARVTLRLPSAVVERLDAMASERGCSRARAFELLIEDGGPPAAAPTRERALSMLAESAEAGSVTARIALERALRTSGAVDPLQRRRDELAARREAREAG
jgi:hypothetical protein